MSLATIMTKAAFLDQMFGGDKGPDWTEKGPGLKALPQRDVTYVQQKEPKPALQREAEGSMDPMMQYMMLQNMMKGQGGGPTISLGGQQQDPMQQMLMMHLMGQSFGKKSALKLPVGKAPPPEEEMPLSEAGGLLGMLGGGGLAIGDNLVTGAEGTDALLHALLGGGAGLVGGGLLGHGADKFLEWDAKQQHMGKRGAANPDLMKMVGRGSEDYARNIMQSLTPEHYQAAGGSGGDDTIEELVNSIIPQQIISRHAMQLGGGNVDLGKSILDSHLSQNPPRSGANLQDALKSMLKANIQGSQNEAAQKALQSFGGEMPDIGASSLKPYSNEDLMAIIEQSMPQAAKPEAAPAQPEPGLSPAMGYPKTGRFAGMQEIFHEIKTAGAADWLTPGGYIQRFRGGPSQQDVQGMGLNRFADQSGEQFKFDPQSFKNVFMQDSSVKNMGRGLGPQATNLMDIAAKPGIMGWMQRGFQKHIMGRGQQLGAAEQGLRNIAEATGLDTGKQPLTRRALSQHFQTMTGTPAGRAGGEIGRQLSGASSPVPSGEGQASSLFGMPGLGKMDLGDPITNMIRQMAMIRSMTSPQAQGPRLGGY